jgi:hypothetical protein
MSNKEEKKTYWFWDFVDCVFWALLFFIPDGS